MTATPGIAIQSAAGNTAAPYERRRPEETTLYQVVQDHVETFFAQVEQEPGTGQPQFVKAKLESFRKCGILAHGFLRLRCGDGAHEKLVPFSCKRRGCCLACGALAGQKVLTWKDPALRLASQEMPHPQGCVSAQGFSLHAETSCAAQQRQKLERLCRYLTRQALGHKR